MRTMNIARLTRSSILTAKKAPVATGSSRDHRNGAGHLDAVYEASLRARVHDRAGKASERAFVSGSWSTDPAAEEAGEEFVISVTSGEDGGRHVLDEVTAEELGGPFVETRGRTEFAYDADPSNPTTATREPFPTS